MKEFIARIGKRLKQPVFSGAGGMSGSGTWGLGTVARLLGLPIVDAETQVGKLWKSSIPLMCLKFEQRAATELQLVIQRLDENGDWANDSRHRALAVLRKPNAFTTTKQLLDAVRWDYHLDGNAYVLKVRSAAGRVVQLWWVPSWMIEPRWDEGGYSFIDCYEYSVNGEVFAIEPADIIHFKNGIDPDWQGRKGLSEFHAACREVMTDDQGATLVASLMKNRGMPGVIVSPKSLGPGGATSTWKKDDRDEFRQYWDEEFTGDKSGRPFMHSVPLDIVFPSYDLQQLAMDKVRAIPEQRIAGAFGLPMSVLQLGSGVANSNSRANKSDDRRQAYESCIIPTAMELADVLTNSLLPDFGGNPTEVRVWFDYSTVICLQCDEGAMTDSLVKACGGPFITVNEARKRRGYKPIDGGNTIRVVQKVASMSQVDQDKDENDQEGLEEANEDAA